jgi:hypothetical protein
MTAVSISVNRGAIMDKMSDFTIGTSAPGVGDIEVRFQVLDTNSKNLNSKDIWLALEQIGRFLMNSGPKVQITNQPSGPPN